MAIELRPHPPWVKRSRWLWLPLLLYVAWLATFRAHVARRPARLVPAIAQRAEVVRSAAPISAAPGGRTAAPVEPAIPAAPAEAGEDGRAAPVEEDEEEELAGLLRGQPVPPVSGVVLDFGELGEVRLFLRPEWSNASADFARATAAMRSTASVLYRVEVGFLVQGSLQAPGLSVGGAKPRAPKLMERGEVGWAGGSGGPDFFIYLGAGPATWLGNPHEGSVWAEVADEASMLVAEALGRLPVPTPPPGGMHMLATPLGLALRPWAPNGTEAERALTQGPALLKTRGASVDSAAASCPESCHALAHTELHGSPLVWGSAHRTPSAAACCAACTAHREAAALRQRAAQAASVGQSASEPVKGCSVWVYCASASLCGPQHRECWLKHHRSVWAREDVPVGTSPRWTTGTAEPCPANHSSGAGLRPASRAQAHLLLRQPLQPAGLSPPLRLHLRLRATGASRVWERLERSLGPRPAQPAAGRHAPAAAAAAAVGSAASASARLLAARPVPGGWGSDALPDGLGPGQRWPAGRALVLGSLGPAGAPSAAELLAPPPAAEWPQLPVTRGAVGWWPSAGGGATGDGPLFFVALGELPHWGLGAVVWAHVAREDMAALDQLAAAASGNQSVAQSAGPGAQPRAAPPVLPLALTVEWLPEGHLGTESER